MTLFLYFSCITARRFILHEIVYVIIFLIEHRVSCFTKLYQYFCNALDNQQTDHEKIPLDSGPSSYFMILLIKRRGLNCTAK